MEIREGMGSRKPVTVSVMGRVRGGAERDWTKKGRPGGRLISQSCDVDVFFFFFIFFCKCGDFTV